MFWENRVNLGSMVYDKFFFQNKYGKIRYVMFLFPVDWQCVVVSCWLCMDMHGIISSVVRNLAALSAMFCCVCRHQSPCC